jgi:Domain of unknown function (DUF6048)
MKYILKYYFSLSFVMFSLIGNAQEVTKKKPEITKNDTVASSKVNRYGLRVGVDLFRLSRSLWENDYRGIELIGDYRLTKKYYIAGELGNEDKTVQEDYLNFTTKGSYFKVGFDYNMHQNWMNLENSIYIGMRYGVSSFSQKLNNYQIYTSNTYFNDSPTVPSGEEFNGLTAQWAEVVAGVKTKVINNIYVGFSFRINRLFTNKTPDGFDNLYIPGFNRKYSGDFGVGFNYTVSYFIPLYKSTVKVEEKPKK